MNPSCWIRVTLLALALSVSCTAFATQPEGYTRAQLLTDFDQLLSFIEGTHPDLARSADLDVLAAMSAQVREQLADGMDLPAAWLAMAQINPLLADAHTGIRRPTAWLEDQIAAETLFPLGVVISSDARLLLAASLGLPAGLTAGSEIHSINGHSAEEILARLLPRMRGETALLRQKVLARYFSEYLLLAFGPRDSFEMVVGNGDGQRARSVTIDGGRPQRLEQQPFTLHFLEAATAYLGIESFELDHAEAFSAFLLDAFAQTAQHGSTRLIIDLRRNGGGAKDLSDQLMAYLSAKPYSPISAVKARVSEENIARIPGASLGQVVALPFQQTVTPPAQLAHRFDGPVYILIGPQTYSQAVVFAATIQDYQLGQLVGEATQSPANQSAQVKRMAAEHTGIEAMAPLYVFTRASGVVGTDPLEPDIPIVDQPLQPMHSVRNLIEQLEAGAATR